MAYIVMIGSATKRPDNNLRDIVAIQDNKPSENESNIFIIEEKSGTAAEVLSEMESSLPEIKKVWLDGDVFKEIVKEPYHYARFIDGKFIHNFGDNKENNVSLATKIKE